MIATDPQSLVTAAQCLDCALTEEQNFLCALYAASTASGLVVTPQSLVTAAQCFDCLTPAENFLITLYLASQILSPS